MLNPLSPWQAFTPDFLVASLLGLLRAQTMPSPRDASARQIRNSLQQMGQAMKKGILQLIVCSKV